MSRDGDRDGLGAVQGLGAARGCEGGTPSCAGARRGPLPHAVGEEDADLGVAPDPPMLEPFAGGLACEAEVCQRGGEGLVEAGSARTSSTASASSVGRIGE